MSHLEFFFDLSSPWTRIAFHNVQPILEETGSTVSWRPFLVGGVFNAVNKSVYEGRADPDNPKIRHSNKWLKDWANLAGLPMNFPTEHHPVRSVHAMRFCCALEDRQDDLFRFASAAFDAYFREGRNLDDPDVLIAIAASCGFDGEDLARQAGSDPIKLKLRQNTQDVIDRGGFGSPTLFVNGSDIYFGNDQLPLVRQALSAA
ncbi:2-hydroxychromene-2-carboxylate isomerase [Henriciella sp. AS95]|uniref:2-hydroxychromene-2-carboxylate isomerase n=1 Tax=Henriciella sp. AS95 TaxID=3135782 RepID=UPI00317D14EE